MEWTREPPTKRGYYWLCRHPYSFEWSKELVRVTFRDYGMTDTNNLAVHFLNWDVPWLLPEDDRGNNWWKGPLDIEKPGWPQEKGM